MQDRLQRTAREYIRQVDQLKFRVLQLEEALADSTQEQDVLREALCASEDAAALQDAELLRLRTAYAKDGNHAAYGPQVCHAH
jgi:hypothetical protein